jgi:predicted AAA+ superfamily ATPase
MDGAGLEGLVAQHLRAWIDYSESDAQLYFWRTLSGNEVDFIVYGPENFYAIEVKNATKLHPRDFGGLIAFMSDYPTCTPLLLYRGRTRFRQKEILCLPCDVFLKSLVPKQKLILL